MRAAFCHGTPNSHPPTRQPQQTQASKNIPNSQRAPPASTPRPSSRQSAVSSTSASGLRLGLRRPAAKGEPLASGSTTKKTIVATRTATTAARSAAPSPENGYRPPSRVSSSIGGTRAPATAARTPLKPRDQNAKPDVTRQLSKQSNMPYERSSATNGSRPQMPTLSATAMRGVNKGPLMPKIATKTPQTPTWTGNAPPLARRAQQATTPISAPKLATPNGNETGDFSDAFGSHLNFNVTPRSGTRKTRVDSANSTPSGTPNPERTSDWDHKAGLGISGPILDTEIRRPVVKFDGVPVDTGFHLRQDAASAVESKFFYASDAKPTQSQPPPPPRVAPSKPATFFYANGNNVDERPTSAGVSSHTLAQGPENPSNKFFYANGAPGLALSPSPAVPHGSRGPASTMSTAIRGVNSRPGTSAGLSGTAFPLAQRPGSPTKLTQQPPLPMVLNDPHPPLVANRGHNASPPQLGPAPPVARLPSVGSSRGSHSRSGSIVSGDLPPTSTKSASPQYLSESHNPLQPPPLTLASIIQAAEEFAEDEDSMSESADEAKEELHSPTKSTHSTDAISELVANARRERKVQDLEIRNASLEAINRTIERQLRKQTAELRRYRRLSRSGRISIASTAASSRAVSEALPTAPGIESLGLSDLDEDFEDDDDLDEDSFSDTDSESDSVSPSLVAERDARHRKRDEQRLQLDLSKHQQLLVDSQKMNQSIKRCLDWTEELIKEGKKALEYHVRVSDVKLGGRILDPLDEEYDAQNRGNLTPLPEGLEITMEDDMAQSTIPVPKIATPVLELPDRDSGIDFPVDGG